MTFLGKQSADRPTHPPTHIETESDTSHTHTHTHTARHTRHTHTARQRARQQDRSRQWCCLKGSFSSGRCGRAGVCLPCQPSLCVFLCSLDMAKCKKKTNKYTWLRVTLYQHKHPRREGVWLFIRTQGPHRGSVVCLSVNQVQRLFSCPKHMHKQTQPSSHTHIMNNNNNSLPPR